MKNNIIKKLIKTTILVLILSNYTYGADQKVLLENSWINIGYSNAKDAMLAGATTSTGKGYSALFTNPAGLSTNYATGLYLRGGTFEHKNATGAADGSLAKTDETKFADNYAIGLFYKYALLEMKPSIHKALGLAYGFETDYGLFSLGANMVKDDTDRTNYKKFGTGDYKTVGFQWQKSFINIDRFYALYFGYSKKGQGVSQFSGEKIYRVSPLVERMGFGAETNLYSTTVLVTLDLVKQSWSHINDELNTKSLGLKWMLSNSVSVAVGYSASDYTTEVDLKDSTTLSAGVELAIWQANIAIAALKKEVSNKAGDLYIQENSLYVDIAFAF